MKNGRNFPAAASFDIGEVPVATPQEIAPVTTDQDLVQLVQAAQAGDRVAFDSIYERWATPMFRYLYLRCGDVSTAEELSGDLWVRVVERLPSFRFPSSGQEAAFAGWLYRIAKNLLIDASRRRGNNNVALSDALVSSETAAEEQVLVGEEHADLREALDHLTAEQREVLLLRFVEERRVDEVARITGRSENAVKVMQHRALGALARLLGGERGRKERGER